MNSGVQICRTLPLCILAAAAALLHNGPTPAGQPPSSTDTRRADSHRLDLPSRPATAPGASELVRRWSELSLRDREQQVIAEILTGNVPEFQRQLVPVRISQTVPESADSKSDDPGALVELQMFVSGDYVTVGSEHDQLRIPLSGTAARQLARPLHCLLPTRKMVDQIYAAGTMRLEPQPLPPVPEMTQLPYFVKHEQLVQDQIRQLLPSAGTFDPATIIAGHKKDVVMSNRLNEVPGRVAIYGWHRVDGRPIQPLYTGHVDAWVDYSHGARLIARSGMLNGGPCDLAEILRDPQLCVLLSDEGPILDPLPDAAPQPEGWNSGEISSVEAGERTTCLTWDPDVRVCINEAVPAGHPIVSPLLVFYALPNGNTIEQTLGRRPQPGDDWRFDIQHVAAQIRFLRRSLPRRPIILILLEARGLSWPAWRKQHPDSQIPRLLSELRDRCLDGKVAEASSIVLSGHSGGGSLLFGYLNAIDEIPAEVGRIAFLDATYAYDTQAHAQKLRGWLAREDSRLCVLAYRDDRIILNGKPIVSAVGGTWYRSRLMRDDLRQSISFDETTDGDLQMSRSPDGRVQFLLHANSENKILHTVQVERNGLIHCLLSGTPYDQQNYRYFGDRAYSEFIRTEKSADLPDQNKTNRPAP